jgi:hypothetical protein
MVIAVKAGRAEGEYRIEPYRGKGDVDQAAGTDTEDRQDPGPPPLRKAPADDVQGVLPRRNVQRDRGSEKSEEMLGPEHGPEERYSGKKTLSTLLFRISG